MFAEDEGKNDVALSARTCSQSVRDCNAAWKSVPQQVLQNSVSSRTRASMFSGVAAGQADVAHGAIAFEMECAALEVDASVTRIGRDDLRLLTHEQGRKARDFDPPFELRVSEFEVACRNRSREPAQVPNAESSSKSCSFPAKAAHWTVE